ncbi:MULTISPECIES: dihydrolipoyllysine-residue acetyltransferase [unclassified Methylophaga]|jgi:pyruvate dehydrogenase E2 component (dihydrolipoamide acetyltransferase)|uniref:dihydrolipoyllysine-residue acetyltransferase n=1 Tax=unclassified Methylophaga TaxID=2629249 RepID=UPI000C93A26C|nr:MULTISPECIES: dihydrolipoyllysine-residue acetyltransferase [unclassified Methylophaga]MAK67691.1 dihydrolipoyllysine-residue acetyltransferase [Methylophaga sp.]MAY18925.1 dihydrolipoyllysine-residue acetyltransferase [Methylophaga sp.]MBN47723.1 dihydrolipoyllysine-residue acetyltransferase [Methylophaga sp.]|tara:strand:+ start:2600 stop:3919 length:1320 start_codon:yes stop_codon:yes gene_type:complete
MADLIELKVPDIGDFDSVEIIEVLVAEGDSINADQEVITIESDKAMMEIPSSLSGTIKEMKVKVGDKVSEGSVIALIESSDAGAEENEKPAEKAAESKPAEKEKPAAAESKPAPTPTVANPEPERTETLPYAPDTGSAKKPSHASPSVRQFARELGVPLAAVVGSGQKGRITKEDVQNFVKQVMNAPAPKAADGAGIPSVPVVNFEQFGEIESKELSRIKKISGKHLHACWLNIPHVTQFDEADITELEEFRQENKEMAAKKGVSLTPLVFIMKAVVACLRQYPEFNASLSEDKQSLIYKKYYNIGVAVDTPNGLMVPVIRDVDKKGFLELAGELGEISVRAREGTLTAKDLQGGTFSISSLGGIGGQFFTPIVNAPEVAILGVSRHQMKPVWNGKEFEPRLMLPLSISYDHRVIDGAAGARFTVMLNQMLSDIRKVLL